MIEKIDPAEIDALLREADFVHRSVDNHLHFCITRDLPRSYIKLMSRIKSRDSIVEKLARKSADRASPLTARDLHDLVGFRLVCHFQADVSDSVRVIMRMIKEKQGLSCLAEPPILYTTNAPHQNVLSSALDSIFQEHGVKLIHETKTSRYTSLHLIGGVTNFEKFPPIEIQLRNVFEEAWSSIEHASNYKRPASKTVTRHLGVLQSMVQCCVEYAEAIRQDMDDGGIDQSASIKPLTYQEDIAQFPKPIQDLLNRVMDMREAEKHQEILERITEFLQVDTTIQEDPLYFVRMEEALSYLKLNDLSAAQSLYENIALKYPRRAMVAFRLSDVFKLKNEYATALEYSRKAIELLSLYRQGSSRLERDWISKYVPLKNAYYLWRLGDVVAAHRDLSQAYEILGENGDEGLRRKYFSSLIYYALEVALSEKTLDARHFSGYLAQMRSFGMDSIKTAVPEEVDTYAWVCHHLGLSDEAKRAILEVLSCLQASDPALGPMFVHKGKHWGITYSDVATIHEHIRIILSSDVKIPVTEIKPH